jgi:hypothetical protein
MGAAVTGVVESESLVVVIALTIMIAMRTFSSGAMRDAYVVTPKQNNENFGFVNQPDKHVEWIHTP